MWLLIMTLFYYPFQNTHFYHSEKYIWMKTKHWLSYHYLKSLKGIETYKMALLHSVLNTDENQRLL